MAGHTAATPLVPQALKQQVMHWVSVEQESQVPAVVAAATGAAKVAHNMAAAAAVLVGLLATWSLYATLRRTAMEMVN
jgi:ABC-type nickel/cobalt efflux system permease component RcnA